MAPEVAAVSRVSAIMNCANAIHGRRWPRDGKRNESMTGPQMNLKVQGRMASATTVAVSALPWPAWLSVASRAMVANPQGKPWQK